MNLTSVEMTEHDDGRVELNWSSDGLSGQQLDKLIQALGGLRAGMQPPVPASPPKDGTFLVVDDPVIPPFPRSANSKTVVHVRHPALGWLVFAWSPAKREELARQLRSEG